MTIIPQSRTVEIRGETFTPVDCVEEGRVPVLALVAHVGACRDCSGDLRGIALVQEGHELWP